MPPSVAHKKPAHANARAGLCRPPSAKNQSKQPCLPRNNQTGKFKQLFTINATFSRRIKQRQAVLYSGNLGNLRARRLVNTFGGAGMCRRISLLSALGYDRGTGIACPRLRRAVQLPRALHPLGLRFLEQPSPGCAEGLDRRVPVLSCAARPCRKAHRDHDEPLPRTIGPIRIPRVADPADLAALRPDREVIGDLGPFRTNAEGGRVIYHRKFLQ
ncbi:hypothetical protein ACVIW2_002552 [Bradyrhizobium huanghuaihaiense]|uniref:Uncharacterized protein n=1 Tax=Bradyrhizobium huanghuaihaiense TaxID=990078 RepID=A0A562QVB3_9BRAD|nr:hypothetical protein IQ16_07776 [Bradyrhizobium huanghuaihaiense]